MQKKSMKKMNRISVAHDTISNGSIYVYWRKRGKGKSLNKITAKEPTSEIKSIIHSLNVWKLNNEVLNKFQIQNSSSKKNFQGKLVNYLNWLNKIQPI